MQEITKIALDAMGGDNAPCEVVKAAVKATQNRDDIFIYLVGQEDVVNEELAKYTEDKSHIQVVDAPEVIEMAEPPVMAIRKKKNSSIVVGMNLVKKKEADAFVSAGSSGAILVGGQLIVGRIKGVERPPLAPLLPTERGVSLLIDCGANVDARASHLVQFAKMGSIYMENVLGVEKPKVAIVNIGAEEEKGNALVKETYPLLKVCKDINFVGSIEARDIPKGEADVIVMAGMGGPLMQRLLIQGEQTARSAKNLILSPQSEVERFRRFLHENRFRVVDEVYIEDENKIYVVMRCISGEPEEWTDLEFRYGKYPWEVKDALLLRILEKEIRTADSILEELKKQDSVSAEMRSCQLRKQINIE